MYIKHLRYLAIFLVCSLRTFGQTPSYCDRLIQAAKEGLTTTVLDLLDKGINVDCRGAGQYTALIAAAKTGQAEMVKLLCSKKADVNAQTEFRDPEEGYTALLWAIDKQNPLIVEVLLENGADANIVDGWGESPLMYAAWKNNLPFVRSLIAHGADASYRKPADGRSALFNAMHNKNLSMVEFLVSHGADPKIKDSDGRNLLMRAADSFLEGVKYCVNKGIGINDRSKRGITAIHCAAGNDSDEASAILRFLIEMGGEVSARDDSGGTPLMEAARAAAPGAINILINSGANVKDRDNTGSTALHYAAMGRGTECKNDSVISLLSRGAEIEARDNEGRTPLLVASKHGEVPALKELIRHKANVNAQDVYGLTGLMHAARENNVEALKLLLKSGADPDIKENSGRTAAMIAKETARTREAYNLLKDFISK